MVCSEKLAGGPAARSGSAKQNRQMRCTLLSILAGRDAAGFHGGPLRLLAQLAVELVESGHRVVDLRVGGCLAEVGFRERAGLTAFARISRTSASVLCPCCAARTRSARCTSSGRLRTVNIAIAS